MSKRMTPAKSAAAKRAAYANQRHQLAISRKGGFGPTKAELQMLKQDLGFRCSGLMQGRRKSYLAGMSWYDYPHHVPHDWYNVYYLFLKH